MHGTTNNPDIAPTPAPAAGIERALAPFMGLVAAMLGALLYWNTTDNPFVYDDYRLIVDNASLRDLSNLWAIVAHDMTRPLVALSYAFDTAVWGLAPYGYHLTNILLHTLNVLLVFRVALVVCEDRARQQQQPVGADASPRVAAFSAAVLFAVHPMMSEAVGYITGRAELAYGSFFLVAFLAGRQWMRTDGTRWWIACLAFWMSALMAKETAVALPFVLLAYDWFLLEQPEERRRRRLLVMGVPLVAFTMLAAAGRVGVLLFVERRSLETDWRYGLMAAEALWRYLGLFAFPNDQSLYHAVQMPGDAAPLRMIAAVAGLVAVPFAAWGFRRIHSVIAFGGLWFVLLLLPSAALFSLGVGEPLAERRGYIAAVGLFLAWGSVFAMVWERTSGRRAMRVAVAMIGVLFVGQLSARTLLRNAIWGEPVQLALESVALAPNDWVPMMILGETLRQSGRCDAAIPAFQQVVAWRPAEGPAYTRLASCQIEERRFDEARATMLQWRSISPTAVDARVTLGILSLLANDPDSARGHFIDAIGLPGADSTPRKLLAFVNNGLEKNEHLRFCDEFHAMSDSFDFPGCVGPRSDDSLVHSPDGAPSS